MWRLRTIIESEVIIELGESKDSHVTFRIFEVNDQNTKNGSLTSPRLRYCDALLSDDVKDIFEAFALLHNKLNCFLDRLSLVSYGKSGINNILSIAPESVKPNEEFEIAFPQITINRKTINIKLSDLKYDIEVTPEQQRWERLLRLGLNATSEEEKYISYYSLLEEIARNESNESIVTTCTNCQHKVDTGRKATNNFIRDLMEKHGIDKKLIKKAPKIRNKIAHGGAEKSKLFYLDVATINSHLEEVCLLELEGRLNVDVINRLHAHIVDIPMVKHICLCNSEGSFDLIQSMLTIPARFVKLTHSSESAFKDQRAMAGIPLDEQGKPFINSFSWPDIVGVD